MLLLDTRIEPPSIEELAVGIEKQRSEATASLEISDDRTNVKCQSCGSSRPIIMDDSKLISSRSISMRIAHLQAMIKQGYSFKSDHEELASLLEGEKKRDFFKRLPLLNSEVTSYKWVCSKCYDICYYWTSRAKKEKSKN